MTMTATEWQAWRLDQRINRAGLPIDRGLVLGAITIDAEHRRRLIERACDLTGLDNPNSRDQLLEWLNGEDIEVDALRKADVAKLQGGELTDVVREVLTIRAELAKSSVKKYHALVEATGDDGRLRGCFQFNGAARTGRWAGRLFQPQNLPRGTLSADEVGAARDVIALGDYDFAAGLYPSVSDTLVSCIRSVIAAPEGKKLVVADFSSIETVVTAWAAECNSLLDVFRTGSDAYKQFAARLFNIDYAKVTKAQRQYTKPIVLGCCYMLGARGLVAYAEGYGVAMTEDEAKRAVATYRDQYPEIVRLWHELANAASLAIEHPGKAYKARKFVFKIEGDFLLLKLPSGRKLAYYKPAINPDGRYGAEITYMGNDGAHRWDRIGTHPGKITENLIQAIARDLLVAAMFNAAADPGLEIVGHVHDEIICLADEDDDTALDRLLGYMRAMPEWAGDAPIGAAGWQGAFYRKD